MQTSRVSTVVACLNRTSITTIFGDKRLIFRCFRILRWAMTTVSTSMARTIRPALCQNYGKGIRLS